MNVNLGGGGGFLVFLFAVWSIAVTVFWMVIAWRAMRAHERLVDAVDAMSGQSGGPRPPRETQPYI